MVVVVAGWGLLGGGLSGNIILAMRILSMTAERASEGRCYGLALFVHLQAYY